MVRVTSRKYVRVCNRLGDFVENLSGSYIADGITWTTPTLAKVNGTMGLNFAGGSGLGHGIVLQRGKYKGRLCAARRYDCKANGGKSNFLHDFVLYSDDEGESWEAGQLLPHGWTECQTAELLNGSLLLTARMAGPPFLSKAHPQSDRRRGFARSDDGGATWAEWWYETELSPSNRGPSV